MISNDIRNIIISLFLEIAKNERLIEISRQVLCESTDFDAHQIFNYLLSNDSKNITISDIMKYLSSNNINITEEQAKLIILFYDKNLDGKLSFDEFINLVKNEKSSINIKSSYPDDVNISFNINFSLCKLFEREINFSQSIINILKDLKCKYSFNIHDIYHSIKSFNFITLDSLRKFLNKNKTEFLESDINLIMRRLDINKDGKIDLCEFHALMGFPNCNFECLCSKCNNCGSSYCDQCYISNHACIPHDCNFPNNYNNNKNIENNNPNIQNIKKNENNEDIKMNNNKEENNFSGNLVNYDQLKRFSNFSIGFNTNGSSDKENILKYKKFNDFIKFLLEGENKIEKIKIDLCKNKDFNIEDTFRLFEKNGRGYLELDDLRYGLGVLNVYPSDFNMKLFCKRYDLQKKGFFSFADFYDIVVPFEKTIREEIEKRMPKTNCAEVKLNRLVNYSLNKIFKILLDFENKVNIERNSLNINIRELFSLFDSNNQGYIYYPNFINYLNNNGLLNDPNINPDLLFIRLDKNRNGRIDFEEFVDELQAL